MFSGMNDDMPQAGGPADDDVTDTENEMQEPMGEMEEPLTGSDEEPVENVL